MQKNVKMLLAIGISVMMLTISVSANTNIGRLNNESIVTVDGNYGVGFEIPGAGVSVRSISKPSEIWDISIKPYDFKGEAGGSTLYTNYKFKGKTSYTITVTNDHTKTLRVKCAGAKGGSKKVKPGKTTTFTVTTKDTSKMFYISFGAPSDFYGTVE